MLFLTSSCLAWISISLAMDVNETSTDVTEPFTAQTTTETVPLNTTGAKQNVSMSRITQPSAMTEAMMPKKDVKESKMDHATRGGNFVPSPQLESFIEYNSFAMRPGVPDFKFLNSYLPPHPPTAAPANAGKYLPPMGHHDRPIITHNPNSGKQDMPREDFYPNTFYLPVGHSITFTTNVPPAGPANDLSVPPAQDKQLIFPHGIEKPNKFEGDFPPLKFYDRYGYGPSGFPSAFYQSVPNLEWYHKMMHSAKQAPLSVDHPYPFVVTDLTRTAGLASMPGHKTVLELPAVKPMQDKMAPWKKAAKIFAAILPIGLLISALTPNILTITSGNDTKAALCRKLVGRAEGLGLDRASVEKWSKPGCEARLLCETATREDSIDVDRVKKLFWSFVSQNAEDSETAVDIEAVSNAIREKKCEQISCRTVSAED